MALMHQLKPFLPGTLDVCYELRPLTPAAAEEAVLNPAYDLGQYRTPRFDYEDDALDALLGFLSSGRKQNIESFQLQILCEHLEKNVVERAKRSRVAAEDLADPEGILENYYLDKIGEIADPGQRLAARKLIEEGLIFEEEERRVTLFEGQIQRVWGVDTALLARLEDTHLLRREPSLRGGYTYELSHDTLVAPVLKAKAKRRADETRAESEAEEARKAEELKALREQAEAEKRRAEEAERLQLEAQQGRKRARMFAVLAAAVAVVAIGLGVFANAASQKAQLAETKTKVALDQVTSEKAATETERQKAVASADLAQKNALKAEAANALAQTSLVKAQTEEAKTKAALLQVNSEKAATEAQRKKAEENYALAQVKTKEAEQQADAARLALAEQQKAVAAQQKALAEIARRSLRDAQTQIYHLDYEAALATMQSAAALHAAQKEVGDALLEIAFFYAETGRFERAKGVMDTAATLVGRDLSTFEKLTNLSTLNMSQDLTTFEKLSNLNTLRQAIKTLNPARLDSLDARYFPTMLPIPGGADTLGSEENEDEKPRHAVTLSAFKMAQTETTWWQYNLFCEATGKEKPDNPGWGSDGDNPVVNVSWYDAAEYANWLSEHLGQKPFYDIDKTTKDATNLSSMDDLKWKVRPSIGAKGYRLPTEAEWEYAARAGKEYAYAGDTLLAELGWYVKNSGNRTRPVSGKKANAFGLYDMSGNVWEWCWDWYGTYDKNLVLNPVGADKGAGRVYRGGGWANNAGSCRVSNRAVPSRRTAAAIWASAFPSSEEGGRLALMMRKKKKAKKRIVKARAVVGTTPPCFRGLFLACGHHGFINSAEPKKFFLKNWLFSKMWTSFCLGRGNTFLCRSKYSVSRSLAAKPSTRT
jgi:formylglycine-generating enzyme required for sulfatase activity